LTKYSELTASEKEALRQKLFKEQNGRCACCGQKIPSGTNAKAVKTKLREAMTAVVCEIAPNAAR